MTDERDSKPSGSGRFIWKNCNAQPSFVKDLPEIEDADETTVAGTAVHDALQKRDPSALTAEQREDYNAALKQESSILAQWQSDFNIEHVKKGPSKTRFWMNNPATLDPISSGEFDEHWISPPFLLIEDFKTQWCKNLAPSESNDQGQFYAVLGWLEYEGITHVRFALNKPKLKAEPIDWVDYIGPDLQWAHQSILLDLWRTQQPNAPFSAGSWCRWCKGKSHCQTAAAYSLLPSVIGSDGKLSIIEKVQTLAPADLVRLWEAAPVVKKILEAALTRLKGFSDEELTTLGMKRGKPKNLDPIVKTKEAFDLLKQLVPEHEIWSAMKVSKTDLVDAVQKALIIQSGTAVTQKAASDWIKTNLADCIEKKPSEPSLVKI